MNDTFRLDLEGYDQSYIYDVLNTFFEDAHEYRRRLIEVRMTQTMFDMLKIGENVRGSSFRGIPVTVTDTGFEGTIEVILAPVQ